MPKKKPITKRAAAARRMDSTQLCISLVSIAAFHVEDKTAQAAIYEAVRRLQLLDNTARAAGLLPRADR